MRLGFLLALALVGISGNAAGDCIDYGRYIHWIGESEPTIPSDIVISGNLAYVTIGSFEQPGGSLAILDISNPKTPVWVGSIGMPNTALGLAISGSMAYVAAAQAGLVLVNVSNPAAPVIVKTVDTPGVAEDVALSGTTAYVADYSSGLKVIDVSDPARAAIIGGVDTPGDAFGVALSGTKAYVADEYFGLQVIDISNPLSPSIVGTVDTPANAQDVAAAGTMVYVADAQSGLQVINVANPALPVIVGSMDTPGYAWDLNIYGSLIYLADGPSGLQVIDVSNPAQPSIIVTKDTPGKARAVALSGTNVFVADALPYVGGPIYGIEVFDVSHLASVPITGSVLINSAANAGGAVVVAWPLACVADGDLAVVDISNPASPVVAGKVKMPGSGQSGQQVFSQDVVVVGRTAYVSYIRFIPPPTALIYADLAVIDLSNPAFPEVLGYVETPNAAGYSGVAVSGPNAFLCDGDHLFVIDVSDPHHPNVVGTLSGVGSTSAVAASGSLVYLTSSDPYTHTSKFRVLDVSNPAVPTILGTANTGGGSIILSGDYAYLSTGSGFQVVQISTPQSPTVIGGMSLLGRIGSVALSGTHLYAAAQEAGVHVVDVSNPSAPTLIGGFDASVPTAVTVSGSWVYATTGPDGLVIAPAQCPAETAVSPQEPTPALLGQAVPNPTVHGSTRIPFTVPRRGSVNLRILDFRGREIRTLVDRVLEAGSRSVIWDGRDDTGNMVPAGIYFYDFRIAGAEVSRKLVWLR